ncbi:hypothetical protein D3C76_1879940 [compost metagenome]
MLHARLLPDVVLADALQLLGVPAIHPAIADVGQGEALSAQHQRTDGGEQRQAATVGLQPAVLRQ